jgi:hypothetical protein
MLIQRVPEKANLTQEPAGACRALAVGGEPLGNHNTTVVGGMDSNSWGLDTGGSPCGPLGIALAGEQPCLGTAGP